MIIKILRTSTRDNGDWKPEIKVQPKKEIKTDNL